MAKIKVDIIILANSKSQKYIKMTQDCIDSILASESNVEWNILVVESNPKSKPYKGATSTIAPNEKFNYNRFINYAIESNTLHAPYLTILNNDVICHKWWASALIEAIRDNQLDSACLKTRNWAPHVGLDESKAIHYGWEIGKEVTGWCWMFRRSSFDKLYPLDERFEFWCQDKDVAIRMENSNMKHAIATSSSISHLVSQSHDLLQKDKERMTVGMGKTFKDKWVDGKEKILIAITTRNRPNILDIALKYIQMFTRINANYELHVVDDCSTKEFAAKNKESCKKYGFNYHLNTKRLGIANSKNKCLSFAKGFKHIFLLDDDVWPVRFGWEQLYINASLRLNVNHLVFMFLYNGKYINNNFVPTKDFGHSFAYRNTGGVILYLTNKVLDVVGGFNPNFGIYGYEHAEYSDRIYRAKLQNGKQAYISPKECGDFFYSIDIHKNIFGIIFDLEDISQQLKEIKGEGNGSMNNKKEIVQSIAKNQKIYTASKGATKYAIEYSSKIDLKPAVGYTSNVEIGESTVRKNFKKEILKKYPYLITNEIKMLKKMEKYENFPNIIEHGEDYIVMKKIVPTNKRLTPEGALEVLYNLIAEGVMHGDIIERNTLGDKYLIDFGWSREYGTTLPKNYPMENLIDAAKTKFQSDILAMENLFGNKVDFKKKLIEKQIKELGKRRYPGSTLANGKSYHDVPIMPETLPCYRKDNKKRLLEMAKLYNFNNKIGMDIGCSIGGMSFHCLQGANAKKMFGIDIDDTAITFARIYSAIYNLNARFDCIDISKYRFPKTDFTLWLSNFMWIVKAHGFDFAKNKLQEIKSDVLFFETSTGDGMAGDVMKKCGIISDEKVLALLKANTKFKKFKLIKSNSWLKRTIFYCYN